MRVSWIAVRNYLVGTTLFREASTDNGHARAMTCRLTSMRQRVLIRSGRMFGFTAAGGCGRFSTVVRFPRANMATRSDHLLRILLGLLYLTAAFILVSALLRGWTYYLTPLAERTHLPDYRVLRPAGLRGHAYGLTGSLLLLLLLLYSARKRSRRLDAMGTPAQWLQVHICFGIIGPCLILLHTSFKVHGLVAVSFWSMMAVALSGIFGRWLYLQIPRYLAGQELSRVEIVQLESELSDQFHAASSPRELARLARRRARLERNVRRLETIRGIFHWWHVVHKPFAIIMLIIMGIHVVVAVSLGYTWVF
jgi:hypothetical protein